MYDILFHDDLLSMRGCW